MATDPNYRDPATTTTTTADPAVRDPAARDTHYRDPHVTEDRSSGGIGKWVLIALAALAIALLASFFLGGDDDAVVEEATVIEEPVVEETPAVVDAEPVVEEEPQIEVVTTDDPIAPDATETVPTGEAIQADGDILVDENATDTETATAPVIEETAPAETTDTATTPLATEGAATDATETGSIETADPAVTVLPADGEAPATEGVEFETVPVQTQ